MKIRSIKYLCGEGLKNVWSHRLMSAASAGVLVACMLMIGIVWALSLNIDNAVDSIEDQNVVMVFFEDDLSRQVAEDTSKEIAKYDNVKSAEFISREDGLKAQKESMGEEFAELFDLYTKDSDDNPLPDGCRVTIEDLSDFDATLTKLEKFTPGVQIVRSQRELVNKLTTIRSIVNIVGFGVIFILLIIALVIVSNTIKVTMYTRKLEINIMKAVGATNSFIRLPFVIEGMLLGMFSGVCSTGILYFIYKIAEKSFSSSFDISFAPFTSFAWPLLAVFVIIGAGVGALGSVLSIGKYLRHEGSEFNALI